MKPVFRSLRWLGPVVLAGGIAAGDVPFKAKLSGQSYLAPTADPCVSQVIEQGGGTGTHVGKFTWESHELANFCAVPGQIVADGQFVITAADGSQLSGSYHSTGAIDLSTFTANFSGQYEATSGTGRFEEAAGAGAVTAHVSLLDGTFGGELLGRLDHGD